ncbi:MAG: mechanosensitive ion channel protein [Ignavibacteriae bacterium HGW-Ignavibacteriae-3]|nr:MAG: mechanosensitive ion channel protein [Ignavibacteriae bacterium HGW-Ignavibacteriae-3]
MEDIVSSNLSPDSIRVSNLELFSNITLGKITIMSLSDEDAANAGVDRATLANTYSATIIDKLKIVEENYSTKNMLISIGVTLVLLLLLIFIFLQMKKYFPKAYYRILGLERLKKISLKFRGVEIVSGSSIINVILSLVRILRIALSLLLPYFFLKYTLGNLPWTNTWNYAPIVDGIFSVIVVTVVALIVNRATISLFKSLITKVESWKGSLITTVKIKQFEIFSEDRAIGLILTVTRSLKLFIHALIAYLYFAIIFSFFPFSQNWANTLLSYVLDPLETIIMSFINYLPNLFTIIVILFVTRYAIRFLKVFFDEISNEKVVLEKFHKDWADPTFKIVRFLIYAFTAIVIFPYLPGSQSPVFQGISVFIGVLFSFGSSSAISNIVAGVVLTYMRPFKIGDRVKIADTTGDIVEKTLLVTRVRTIKNVDISIPNSMIMGSHIINFSSSSSGTGLILHTGVTIGYDAPWKTVHELLINAALATSEINKEPKPFVLQTSLDDFYVSYELNAYTNSPNIMAKIYSELHSNIQDKFNEAGVEIMSPHYGAHRDGNQTTIPENYLPKTYQAPSFRFFDTSKK